MVHKNCENVWINILNFLSSKQNFVFFQKIETIIFWGNKTNMRFKKLREQHKKIKIFLLQFI